MLPALLLCFVGALVAVPFAEPGEDFDADIYRVRIILDAEVYRPGGPRQDRVKAVLTQAIAGGNVRVVGEIIDRIAEMADRRSIKWASLGPLFEDLKRFGDPHALGQEIALEALGEAGRRELYRSCVASSPPACEEYGLTWELAGRAALAEGMDDLRPEIERALASRVPSSSDRTGLKMLTTTWVPLSRARDGDWVANHLELLRQLATQGPHPPALNGDSREHRLALELIADLAQRGGTRALEGPLEIWRSLPAQEVWGGDQKAWEAKAASAIAAGKADPEVMHAGPLTQELRLAISALGRPRFQEKNIGPGFYVPSPQQAEKDLRARGVFKQPPKNERP